MTARAMLQQHMTGSARTFSSDRDSGSFTKGANSLTTTWEAKAPPQAPETRSPGAKRVTSAPTRSTMPVGSWPKEAG